MRFFHAVTDHKIPQPRPAVEHVAEGGLAPVSRPLYPTAGCQCLSPDIYSTGVILDTCQRCGLPYQPRGRSQHPASGNT